MRTHCLKQSKQKYCALHKGELNEGQAYALIRLHLIRVIDNKPIVLHRIGEICEDCVGKVNKIATVE